MNPQHPYTWLKEAWEQPPGEVMALLCEKIRSLQGALPVLSGFSDQVSDYIFYSNKAEGIKGDMGATKALIQAKMGAGAVLAQDVEARALEGCTNKEHQLNRRFVIQHFFAFMSSKEMSLGDFSVESIKLLHRILMNGLDDAGKDAPVTPGEYRTHHCHAVGIHNRQVDYLDYGNIANNMASLVDATKVALAQSAGKGICPEAFFIAGQFLARFLYIHPFGDGNGRLARLLVNWILYLHGFPTVVMLVTGKHKNAQKHYLRMLDKVQHGERCMSYAASFVLFSAYHTLCEYM